MRSVRLAFFVGGITGLVGGSAPAQVPTFSLEATAVNDVPVVGGRTSRLIVVPGDVLTVKIYLRDWSPNGELMRSYQATLDGSTFSSGAAGSIHPPQFGTMDFKDDTAFIDEKADDYVHKGLHTIPVVAARPDYRWISVLFAGDEAHAAKQDGRKYSCGTMQLNVSDDARGTFTISLFKDREVSMLLNPESKTIEPLEVEPLIIDVAESTRWARIRSSEPPSGAIDARCEAENYRSSSNAPWQSIQLRSSGDGSEVEASDFTIADGTTDPPRIKRLTAEGSTVTVALDRPIRAGAWTTITHTSSNTNTRIGFLPGDVNNDGRSNTRDVLALIDSLNGTHVQPDYQTDINRDGVVGGRDLARLIDLLASESTRERRLRNN